jgi:hypothetical protein
MCTLTWAPEREGYLVAFNRDERRLRPRAQPPRIGEQHGVRFIAPIDPEGGGTWIGVNVYGITLCLLNRYDAVTAPAQPISRGRLVADLLALAVLGEVTERIPRADLGRYRPFTLVAFAPASQAIGFHWDGTCMEEIRVAHPGLVAVSSAAGRDIEMRRAAMIERELGSGLPLDASSLTALHARHWPDDLAASVCMHREEAETVSSTLIQVTGDEVRLRYIDGAPCRGATPKEFRLARAVLVPVA